MSHIVILCPPAYGYINPLACLGRELQVRGHRVTMPQLLDMEETVARTGLEYFPLAEKEFPPRMAAGFRGPAWQLARVGRVALHTPGCCTRCRCDTAQCRAYVGERIEQSRHHPERLRKAKTADRSEPITQVPPK